jgi:DNA adenine methylase
MNSPLRYPGGKAKLYPYISALINECFEKPPVYAEAFAGGFGLGIKLLLNGDVSSVIINDYDRCIYSFWKCVSSEKYHDDFIQLITYTPITIEQWKIERKIYHQKKSVNILSLGFATLFLNRCNHSGVLDANPIGGIDQTGDYKIDCRFNKESLINLINRIYAQREKISLKNMEASDFIPLVDQKNDNLFFNFDPPYVSAGPTLYKNSYVTADDHRHLAEVIQRVKNKWIMTYDDDQLIRDCYQNNLIRQYDLTYSLEDKRMATELIIYSNRIKCPISMADY